MKGRLDIARQKLIDELVTFSMLRGPSLYFLFTYHSPHCNSFFLSNFIHLFISAEVKVVVVFDAMMSGFPTHKEDFAGYSFLYFIYHTTYMLWRTISLNVSFYILKFLQVLMLYFGHFAVLILFSQGKHALIHGLKKRLDVTTGCFIVAPNCNFGELPSFVTGFRKLNFSLTYYWCVWLNNLNTLDQFE